MCVCVCIHHMLVFVSVSFIHLLMSVYMFLLQWWLGMKQSCVILKKDWKNRWAVTDRKYMFIYFNIYIARLLYGCESSSLLWGWTQWRWKFQSSGMWCGVILTKLLENIKFHIIFGKDVCRKSEKIIFASKGRKWQKGCMKLHNKFVHKISVVLSNEIRLRCIEHVACVIDNMFRIFMVNLMTGDHLKGLAIVRRIILKLVK